RHGPLSGVSGGGPRRVGRGHSGDGAGRPRRYHGAAGVVHHGLGHSRRPVARPGHARQDRPAHPQRRRRERCALEARLGLRGGFGIYSTWAAWVGKNYEWGPYLSPFYSPLLNAPWFPFSPAFLILIFPLGFRATCYYYRKAYYRAFFLDPVACAVGEPRHGYT